MVRRSVFRYVAAKSKAPALRIMESGSFPFSTTESGDSAERNLTYNHHIIV